MIIAELMRFYKGALTYQDLMVMSIPEILNWQDKAKIIVEISDKEMERREQQIARQTRR